ncbi:MAG: xanthine dehydrogenase family protein subunit M [Firmicutes bacterium]|nr:xanthine dehydrogenase family protein subunit M [Bacillota bacterium]
MIEFALTRPRTVDEALEVLAELGPRARVLAGGTDLLIYLRNGQGVEMVDTVVDITGLAELKEVRAEAGELALGALVTHAELTRNPQVPPLLARAAGHVGSPQIRNRGTVGGNVANAAVCADTVAPLVALDARVVLQSRDGQRIMPLDEFITGPNRTQLEPGELLTEIRFAPPAAQVGWGFARLARREALAIARMNVAALCAADAAGVLTDVRIAPGSVLPAPARVTEAEQILLGKQPEPAQVKAAGRAVAEKMVAVSGRRWSTDYKEPVICALVERALNDALGVEWK